MCTRSLPDFREPPRSPSERSSLTFVSRSYCNMKYSRMYYNTTLYYII